jgi:trans-2,3-dihydro-3-hydroxyanthranilate isomerase
MSNLPGLRSFEYAVVDVFAERALEGNMLAVFSDARGLSEGEMQALARETNLSETTFILPLDDPAEEVRDGVRVRIFTTTEELPFAGHPTLGTAAWLHANHPALRGAESITLRLNGGPVTVRFEAPSAGRPGIFGRMRQRDPEFGMVHEPGAISRATGIPIADFDSSMPIQTVSTGLRFCIVPLRSVDAQSRLRLSQDAADFYLRSSDAKFFYFVAPAKAGASSAFRARMQFYSGEDPATGSAAGCAIAYLVQKGRVASGVEVVLEQGVEISRPSRLFVQASLTDGEVKDVFVGGSTIPVASGRFSLPSNGRFPQPIVTEQQH